MNRAMILLKTLHPNDLFLGMASRQISVYFSVMEYFGFMLLLRSVIYAMDQRAKSENKYKNAHIQSALEPQLS